MLSSMHLLSTLILFLNVASIQVLAKEKPPVSYGVVVYPGYQMLDVYGPLDILYLLSWDHFMNVSIISSTLEPVTTHPGSNFTISPFATLLQPTHTFDNPPKDLDVLLIPGGLGTRTESRTTAAEAYIKKVFPSLRYAITVCTGSALLARTGLLDGRQATSNKFAWSWATSQGPKVKWVPKARWVVDEQPGKIPIWTSSGVTAGMDAILAFGRKFFGDEQIERISNIIEYEAHKDASYDPFSKIWKVPDA